MFALAQRVRTFATLAPKPSSKRTKTRHFLSPGLPHQRLTRRQTRDPGHNHVLAANQDVSRRERHFRRVLAQAMCAGAPHDPALNEFVPPYWLQVDGVREGTDALKQSHGFDPVTQTTANNRLVRAFTAMRDPQTMDKLKHRGTVREEDLTQVQEMETRQLQPDNLPLIDRVLSEFEQLQTSAFQHQLSEQAVEAVIGSPAHDVGRAALEQSETIAPDTKRLAVEKIIGASTADAKTLNKMRMHRVMKVFQAHATDCGSPRVKSALMTYRIRNMANHLYRFPQDTNTRVELDHLTQLRRKTLEFLKRTDFTTYMQTVQDLGLKVA